MCACAYVCIEYVDVVGMHVCACAYVCTEYVADMLRWYVCARARMYMCEQYIRTQKCGYVCTCVGFSEGCVSMFVFMCARENVYSIYKRTRACMSVYNVFTHVCRAQIS